MRFELSDVKALKIKIETETAPIEVLIDGLCRQCLGALDAYVGDIETRLNDGTPLTYPEIDMILIDIPIQLYYISEQSERLGLRDDISGMAYLDAYNNIILSCDGTVPEKKSYAELGSQKEVIVKMIYSKSYKRVKLKLEYAELLLGSVKKILQRRMSEMELTYIDRGRHKV